MNVLKSMGLILCCLLFIASGFAQEWEDNRKQHDPVYVELVAAGKFDMLRWWRLDDGATVSLNWSFDTPEREGILPNIEVPLPGGQPWYYGSSMEILDPDATWKDGAWLSSDNLEFQPLMSATDTNPEFSGSKLVLVYFWWYGSEGTPTPSVSLVPAGDPISVMRRPSTAYPGYEFVEYVIKIPNCPPSVTAYVHKATEKPILVRGLAIHASCL